MKIFKILNWFSIIQYSFLFLALEAFSFENDLVHPQINMAASYQSVIDSILKNELGIKEGLITTIEGRNIQTLIAEGGNKEDLGARSLNHFHDPLASTWDQAGMLGGQSAVYWSQSSTNNASWQLARTNYWQALQEPEKDYSDSFYANTFLYLGQVMHLVSDMAVPAHARDDAHLEVMLPTWMISHFENYTKKKYKSLNYTGIKPSHDIFTAFQFNTSAPEPISALFDTDSYVGSNPEVTQSSRIGLAEYTNANFFSEGTLRPPILGTNPPHPSLKDDTNFSTIYIKPEAFVSEDGKTDTIKMIYSNSDSVNPIAALSYCSEPKESGEYLTTVDLILNDRVYEGYAAKLVPRAVGYSTALLDYFFRGKLEIETIPIIWANSLVGLEFAVKNITETAEELGQGGTLFVRYVFPEDPSAPSLPILSGGGEYSEITLPSNVPYNGTASQNLRLDFSQMVDFLEFDGSQQHTFVIGFRGRLGDEKDAVIGKVFTLQPKVLFQEDWVSLEGNYPWVHTTAENNLDNGQTINEISDNILIKKNIRLADNNTDNERARYNSTYLDLTTTEFPDGIPIAKSTYLDFNIPKMSIDNRPICPEGITYDYQIIQLRFNDGRTIQLLHQLGVDFSNPYEAYWPIPIGSYGIVNLYEIFQENNIELIQPLFLKSISFSQQLLPSSDSPLDVTQEMDIDFFRITDWHIKTPDDNL